MSAFRRSARWWTVVAVAVLMAIGFEPGAVRATEDGIPENDREAIEELLDTYVRKLAGEKNEAGEEYRRGSFSTWLRPAEGGGYETTLHEDTASPDQLKVERFRVTVRQEGGKWAIVDRQLEFTWDGLQRSFLGDEDFYEFDSFRFEREGLTITGGHGYAARDYLRGELSSWLLSAEDMEYSYGPPPGTGPAKPAVWEIWQQLRPEYIDFDPNAVSVDCTPAECKELWAETLTNPRPVERSQVDSRFVSLFEKEHVKDAKDRLRDDPFAGFRLPPRPESASWSVAYKKPGEDTWLWMTYNTPAIQEVRVGAYKENEFGAVIFSHFDEKTRNAGIDPIDLERRVEGAARRLDIESVKGRVDLALLDSEDVQGDVQIGFVLKEERETLPFRLQKRRGAIRSRAQASSTNPLLFINRLEDGEGNEWSWTRTGASSGLLILPEKMAAGTHIDLRVAFDSPETISALNPTFSYMPRGAWIPLVDISDLIDDFELTVRVPDRYTTIAVGTKISENREGRYNVSQWKNEFPIWFPTVIFGDYIDAEPRSKATRADGSEIPVHIYVDKTAASPITTIKSQSDIQYYRNDVASGRFGVRPNQLRPLAEQAVNALNLYREVWGLEYPFGQLDLVNSPFMTGGGQSPGSIVYLSSDAFRGEAELALLYDGNTRFFKGLVSHEVGHQWWGGLFHNLNRYNYWFIESLAEYSSALWTEAVHSDGGKNVDKGYKEYLKQVEEWRRNVLRFGTTGNVQESDMYRAPVDVGDARQSLVYFKGAFAFHMLRQLVGFEATKKLFQDMGTEFKGKQIVTRDIERVAEESLGRPMGWFFDQWIRGTGIPEYRLQWSTRQAEDKTWIVEGKVQQRIVVGTGAHERVVDGAFLAKVPITVIGKDGQEYTNPLYLREAETPFGFKVPVEPREVELNKYFDTLAHDVVTNEPWGS